METVGMIRLIHPFVNASEKEYIKEFLRFIGCFVINSPVDETSIQGWNKGLCPNNENNGIDIVLNYFGVDPHSAECGRQGTRRIYLYFWFGRENDEPSVCKLTPQPLNSWGDNENEFTFVKKADARQQALSCLIDAIWNGEKQKTDRSNIHAIFRHYTHNHYGKSKESDLFYLLQARKSLRVLHIAELLDTTELTIPSREPSKYIQQILTGLWEMYVKLEESTDIYGIFARINTACIIREITCLVYENRIDDLNRIQFADKHVFTVSNLMQQAMKLLDRSPQFISLYLLIASLCKESVTLDRAEESLYLQLFDHVPRDQKGYSNIFYRLGQFYEKIHKDRERALRCYLHAYKADQHHYPALFKLGYFAAQEGCFNEADRFMNLMIQSVYHDKDMEDPEGKYPQWNNLSLKDLQYVYKAYILRAKIAINSSREYSAKAFIGKACLAATKFEETNLVKTVADIDDEAFSDYSKYHRTSISVQTMWHILFPWTEHIIYDPYIQHIVRGRLNQKWE